MSASSKGGYGGPNTSGPGGQGRDYNGNAIGSRMPGQYAVGGAPRPGIGFGPAPIPGAPPAPGDLYQPGIPQPAVMPPGGRFAPRGMIPPAGARPGVGNPRQFNPGQGPMRPGQPPLDAGDVVRRVINPAFDIISNKIPNPGGKGGFPGPRIGMPVQPPDQVLPPDEMPNVYDPRFNDLYTTTAGNQAGY